MGICNMNHWLMGGWMTLLRRALTFDAELGQKLRVAFSYLGCIVWRQCKDFAADAFDRCLGCLHHMWLALSLQESQSLLQKQSQIKLHHHKINVNTEWDWVARWRRICLMQLLTGWWERTTHCATNGVSVGAESFSDLDFADGSLSEGRFVSFYATQGWVEWYAFPLPSLQTIMGEQLLQGCYTAARDRFEPVTLQLQGTDHTATPLHSIILAINLNNFFQYLQCPYIWIAPFCVRHNI